jgi:hypothetical protein
MKIVAILWHVPAFGLSPKTPGILEPVAANGMREQDEHSMPRLKMRAFHKRENLQQGPVTFRN